MGIKVNDSVSKTCSRDARNKMQARDIRTRCCPIRAWLIVMLLGVNAGAQVLYVDDDAPGDPDPNTADVSDPQEDGSADHPFDSVIEAMDNAQSGYTVIVAPGLYQSSVPGDVISFRKPNIRLVSSNPSDFSLVEQTILGNSITFVAGQSAHCKLAGFKIRGLHFGGIFGNGETGAIWNCLIQGNQTCDGAVLSDFEGTLVNCLIADNKRTGACGFRPAIYRFGGVMQNCTVVGNYEGVHLKLCPTVIENCIVYGHERPERTLIMDIDDSDTQAAGDPGIDSEVVIAYCNIEGGMEAIDMEVIPPTGGRGRTISSLLETRLHWGEGNIDEDPLFAKSGSWETITIEAGRYERYVPGDYHLRSRGWRWTEQQIHGSHWIYDIVSSGCIDAGSPAHDIGDEAIRIVHDPTGEFGINRAINLGVYGGTSQASLAPIFWDEEPPLPENEPLWPSSGGGRGR